MFGVQLVQQGGFGAYGAEEGSDFVLDFGPEGRERRHFDDGVVRVGVQEALSVFVRAMGGEAGAFGGAVGVGGAVGDVAAEVS